MFQEIIYLIIDAIQSAIPVVRVHTNRIMFILLAIDFAIFGLMIALGRKSSLENIVEKLLITGVTVWIILNFESLAYMFEESFIRIAASVGGDYNIEFLLNPGQIMNIAHDEILTPFSAIIDESSGIFSSMKVKIVYGFAWVGVMVSFLIIALQLALTLIEFHFIVVASLFLLPFVTLDATKFIGMKTFPAVLGHGIKLAIVVMTTSITMNVFKAVVDIPNPEAIPSDEVFMLILSILLCSILVAFLSIQIPALANSLLAGIPNMSAAGLIQNVAAMARTAQIGSKLPIKGAVGAAMAGAGVVQGLAGKGLQSGSGRTPASNIAGRAVGAGIRAAGAGAGKMFRAAESSVDKAAPGQWLASQRGNSMMPPGHHRAGPQVGSSNGSKISNALKVEISEGPAKTSGESSDMFRR